MTKKGFKIKYKRKIKKTERSIIKKEYTEVNVY
jgi:hypothetical protein